MGTGEEREGIRSAVRALLARDRDAGSIEPLARYQQLFPGFWDVVAEEWRGLDPVASNASAHAPPTGSSPDASAPTRPGTGAPASPPPPEEKPADRIGPYRVLRELGRGGMGVVYEAEDTRLPRRVALKVLSPQFASSMQLRLRFQREAELASKLDHPHICTVYEAGEDDGTPYLAMRYVEGRPLSDLVVEGRAAGRKSGVVSLAGEGPGTELDRVLLLFEKMARALHAAHEKGLIHRDIKPHNIMVTPGGEPVLLDFGLAREEAGEGHQLTRTGSVMGTPAYMSPEQLMAAGVRLDRRTDVYSLGVSLYECLTLQLPFDAPTIDRLYQKILTTQPENPRKLNRALTEDLKVVLETALEKERERRYQSAAEVADELRRILDREPIRARPPGNLYRAVRFVQRNAQAVTGVVLASLFVGTVLWTFLSTRIGQTPETLVGIADELRAAGNPAGARMYYERALEKGAWDEAAFRGADYGRGYQGRAARPPALDAIARGLVPLLLEDARAARAKGDMEGAARIYRRVQDLAPPGTVRYGVHVLLLPREILQRMIRLEGAPPWKLKQELMGVSAPNLGYATIGPASEPPYLVLVRDLFPALGDGRHPEAAATMAWIARDPWMTVDLERLAAEPAASPAVLLGTLRFGAGMEEAAFAALLERLRSAVPVLRGRAPTATLDVLAEMAEDQALGERERLAALGLLGALLDLCPVEGRSPEARGAILSQVRRSRDLEPGEAWRLRVEFAVGLAAAGDPKAAAWLLGRTGLRAAPEEGWTGWWEDRKGGDPAAVLLEGLGNPVPRDGIDLDGAFRGLLDAAPGDEDAWHTLLMLLAPPGVRVPWFPAVGESGLPGMPPPGLAAAWGSALEGRLRPIPARFEAALLLVDPLGILPLEVVGTASVEAACGDTVAASPSPEGILREGGPPGNGGVRVTVLRGEDSGRPGVGELPGRSYRILPSLGGPRIRRAFLPMYLFLKEEEKPLLRADLIGPMPERGRLAAILVRVVDPREVSSQSLPGSWAREAERELAALAPAGAALLQGDRGTRSGARMNYLFHASGTLRWAWLFPSAGALESVHGFEDLLAAGDATDPARWAPPEAGTALLHARLARLWNGDEAPPRLPAGADASRPAPLGDPYSAVPPPVPRDWILLAAGGPTPAIRSLAASHPGLLSDARDLEGLDLLVAAMDAGRLPERNEWRELREERVRDLRIRERLERWKERYLHPLLVGAFALTALLIFVNAVASLLPRGDPATRLRPAWMLLVLGPLLILFLLLILPSRERPGWQPMVAGAGAAILGLHGLAGGTRGWLPRLSLYFLLLSLIAWYLKETTGDWQVENLCTSAGLGLAAMSFCTLPLLSRGLRVQARGAPGNPSFAARWLGSDRTLAKGLMAAILLGGVLPVGLALLGLLPRGVGEGEVALLAFVFGGGWVLWVFASLRYAVETRVAAPSIPVRLWRRWKSLRGRSP